MVWGPRFPQNIWVILTGVSPPAMNAALTPLIWKYRGLKSQHCNSAADNNRFPSLCPLSNMAAPL